MRFTSTLFEDTQHEPMPWKWLGDTAKRAGIQHDEQFKRAFEVAEAAGWLIVHGGCSVKLTLAGIRAVRRFLDKAEDMQLGVAALDQAPGEAVHQLSPQGPCGHRYQGGVRVGTVHRVVSGEHVSQAE